MVSILSIKDLSVNGSTVLVRVDFNVPLDKNAKITDDSRIQAALPTIKYLLSRGAAVILMSHLGRPKGKWVPGMSLRPIAEHLQSLLGRPVSMAADCVGEQVNTQAQALRKGQLLLLENLRFHQAETMPDSDPSFAKQLAALGDYYVNDAFGTAHRAHSSTVKVAQAFPGRAAAGFLILREIEMLDPLKTDPKRPFIAIVGGAKVSSKLGVVDALVETVDTLVIGGAMAFTLLKAQGVLVGRSLCENDLLDRAAELIARCKERNVQLLLPVDIVAAEECRTGVASHTVTVVDGIPDTEMGLDIGPESVKQIISVCRDAKTVLWNGPMGVFEVSPFDMGTVSIAHALSCLDAVTVVGGGDSVDAVNRAGVADKISHLSTGGGACLEYIEYGHLPGIDALKQECTQA
ncbi:Phosphoglycerate kinase [Chlamydiales bacterium SCGC AG-110-P3]|nr:Phosphoglycerate kinase [Chlamydiales bacterium SCGC AG-110-P3]